MSISAIIDGKGIAKKLQRSATSYYLCSGGRHANTDIKKFEMQAQSPGLFGITNSNRDFSLHETWGKNQFNSSFPAALTCYLASKGLGVVYICVDDSLKLQHDFISVQSLFGIEPESEDLFFSFESPYNPYQHFLIGSLPRVDLVTQKISNGTCLRPLEIKLTALPDQTTFSLTEDLYSCELVIRPDTIVYLACSIIEAFKEKRGEIREIFGDKYSEIVDWTDGTNVWSLIPSMAADINMVLNIDVSKQSPLLLEPIWKTLGKSSILADNCLDVFAWSDFAFTQLIFDAVSSELTTDRTHTISRQLRTVIWLFKMIFDYSDTGHFNSSVIIDSLSYNTKNDKAFSVSGKITHKFLSCDQLLKPRILKTDIKNIILGGGQNLLSPERRFDAILSNTPDLFD